MVRYPQSWWFKLKFCSTHTCRHMLNKESQIQYVGHVLRRNKEDILRSAFTHASDSTAPLLCYRMICTGVNHKWCETLSHVAESIELWVVGLYATPLSDSHPVNLPWKEIGQSMMHVCKQSHTCRRLIITWCQAVFHLWDYAFESECVVRHHQPRFALCLILHVQL